MVEWFVFWLSTTFANFIVSFIASWDGCCVHKQTAHHTIILAEGARLFWMLLTPCLSSYLHPFSFPAPILSLFKGGFSPPFWHTAAMAVFTSDAVRLIRTVLCSSVMLHKYVEFPPPPTRTTFDMRIERWSPMQMLRCLIISNHLGFGC